MVEARETRYIPTKEETPADVITFDGEKFTGTSSFYEETPEGFNLKLIDFNIAKGEPLSPFKYNKPPDPEKGKETSIPKSNEFKLDEKPREGNYPLALVKKVRRPPNHFYQSEDGILTAVEVKNQDREGTHWETRFYPKSCLNQGTWDEAERLLIINKARQKST